MNQSSLERNKLKPSLPTVSVLARKTKEIESDVNLHQV